MENHLVTLSDFADDVLLGDLDVVERELTSRRSSNTKLFVSETLVVLGHHAERTFASFLVISTPMSLLMTKQVIPLYPAEGSTLAKT